MPEPNPCLDIVKMYHDLGGDIITVGSDAHEVKYFAIIAWGSLDIGIETYDNALFQAFSRNYIVDRKSVV